MPKRERLYSPFSAYAPDYAEVKVLKNVENFDIELEFTDAYRKNINEHITIRKARSLQALFTKVFQDIQPGDIFAGRTCYHQIGFGLENASGGPGFYCYSENLRTEKENADIDSATQEKLESAMDLWATEATIDGKLVASLLEDVKKSTSNEIASMGGRLSGAMMDFEKLIKIGIPGLLEQVQHGKEKAAREGGDEQLFEGMILANLDYLYIQGAAITLRCLLIPGVNDTLEHLEGIATIAEQHPNLDGIELMAYHDLGKDKGLRLGQDYPLEGVETASEAAKTEWLETLALLGCERAVIG